MIKELGFPHSLIPVYEDNRPAIAIIYRNDFSQRVRHMRMRDLWVSELCSTDLMRVFYVNTRYSIADFFTKVIATVHFKKVILILSGYGDKLHVPAWFLLILVLTQIILLMMMKLPISFLLLMKPRFHKYYITTYTFFYI